MLNAGPTADWHERGFVVLPGFKPADEVAAACARACEIVEAFEPGGRHDVFSSRHRAASADAALFASAEAIHGFFEEDAFDAAGRLVVPKARAVNKVGHALHDLDPFFARFSRGPALAALAAAFGLERPLLWQSQLIFKQPGIGGEVTWHQDASFFVTTPQTVTTFWFALEDATPDNGCLWVLPGGHRGPLREVFERAGDRLVRRELDPAPWPDDAAAQPLPVAAGTLVCFHGLLPHRSGPNRSPRSRLAYVLHATDAGAAYAPGNWLQRRAGFAPRGFA